MPEITASTFRFQRAGPDPISRARLGRISKRGDGYIRRLMIHGAPELWSDGANAGPWPATPGSAGCWRADTRGASITAVAGGLAYTVYSAQWPPDRNVEVEARIAQQPARAQQSHGQQAEGDHEGTAQDVELVAIGEQALPQCARPCPEQHEDDGKAQDEAEAKAEGG
jgi:hypothetical protein